MLPALLITVTAYSLGGTVVWSWVRAESRLLALGTLPAGWISLLAMAGWMQTCFGLPARGTVGGALVLLIVAVVALLRRPAREPPTARRGDPVTSAALVLAAMLFGGAAAIAARLEPWGGWDAMFTWVLRGKFFHDGGDLWRNTFSNDLALLHPDYPPLLGWGLAALWSVSGEVSPAATSWLILPVWPGLMLVLLGWNRSNGDRNAARLTFPLAVLLGTPILWKLAVARLADFVLGYAIAASAAWWCAARRSGNRGEFALAGFIAAWGGLIKNEGALWFAAFGLVTLLSAASPRRKQGPGAPAMGSSSALAPLLAGAALPFLALVLFKMRLAPPSDLVDPTRVYEVGEILQPGILTAPLPLIARLDQAGQPLWHRFIRDRFADVMRDWSDWGATLWLIAGLLLWRVARRVSLPALFWGVLLQVTGYYAVYLITPYHPYWHLSTSLSRIMTHVVPAAVGLLALESAGTPPKAEVAPRTARVGWTTATAAAWLVAMCVWNVVALQRGDWGLGRLPTPDVEELAAIELPRAPVMSYVSSTLGIQDVYGTQFAATPSVLVVDRREKLLLARFANDEDLERYCRAHGWRLERQNHGLGWARDAGGSGLAQPVQTPRLQ